jgi:hypothetical protein
VTGRSSWLCPEWATCERHIASSLQRCGTPDTALRPLIVATATVPRTRRSRPARADPRPRLARPVRPRPQDRRRPAPDEERYGRFACPCQECPAQTTTRRLRRPVECPDGNARRTRAEVRAAGFVVAASGRRCIRSSRVSRRASRGPGVCGCCEPRRSRAGCAVAPPASWRQAGAGRLARRRAVRGIRRRCRRGRLRCGGCR